MSSDEPSRYQIKNFTLSTPGDQLIINAVNRILLSQPLYKFKKSDGQHISGIEFNVDGDAYCVSYNAIKQELKSSKL